MDEDNSSQSSSPEWRCRSCIRVFDTRGKRDSHHRREHQASSTGQTTFGEKYTVTRRRDGDFRCVCGLGYKHSSSLKRHKTGCNIAVDVFDVTSVEEDTNNGSFPRGKLLIVDDEAEDEDGSIVPETDPMEEPLNILLHVDSLYNLIVGHECGVGIPLEWAVNHPSQQHRIKMKVEEIRRTLELEHEPMTLQDATDWVQSVWVGRAVQGIPVKEGLRCMECEYSAATRKVMVNHFVKEHRGLCKHVL